MKFNSNVFTDVLLINQLCCFRTYLHSNARRIFVIITPLFKGHMVMLVLNIHISLHFWLINNFPYKSKQGTLLHHTDWKNLSFIFTSKVLSAYALSPNIEIVPKNTCQTVIVLLDLPVFRNDIKLNYVHSQNHGDTQKISKS